MHYYQTGWYAVLARMSTKMRTGIFCMGTLIVVAPWYFFLYEPLRKELHHATLEHASLEKKVVHVRGGSVDETDSLKHEASPQEQFEGYKEKQSMCRSLYDALSFFSDAAQRSGALLTSYEAGRSVAHEWYTSYENTLMITGTLEQIGSFFVHLNQGKRLMRIRHVTVHKRSHDQYEATAQCKVYYVT